MNSKGWNLSTIYAPKSIHITVTHANVPNWKLLVKDLKDGVQEVPIKIPIKILANPAKYKGGSAGAIYGTTQ
jgi:hypothetical protein